MQQTIRPHQQTAADFTLVLPMERNIPEFTIPLARLFLHIKRRIKKIQNTFFTHLWQTSGQEGLGSFLGCCLCIKCIGKPPNTSLEVLSAVMQTAFLIRKNRHTLPGISFLVSPCAPNKGRFYGSHVTAQFYLFLLCLDNKVKLQTKQSFENS